MDQTNSVFSEKAPNTKLWYQLDRGGDCWPVLNRFTSGQEYITVRAAQDRKVVTRAQEQQYLWQHMAKQPIAGTYQMYVPACRNRATRMANMQLRYCPVTVEMYDDENRKTLHVQMWAVSTKEKGTTPPGEEPIEWLLLTNYPVKTLADAQLVIEGYVARWRVEEFHKAWKSGACRVEDNQLRDYDHVLRWAIVLAAVAMRILRLTYLARVSPNLPASCELSPPEIRAVVAAHRKHKPRSRFSTTPTIAQAVLWIAELGGYTGASSGGPPGALVLARGLQKIEFLAAFLPSVTVNK